MPHRPSPSRAAEDDDLVDGTATISHTAVGVGYDGVTGEVDAIEQDNDTAGLVFSTTDVDVPEGGDATYTVKLSRPAQHLSHLGNLQGD